MKKVLGLLLAVVMSISIAGMCFADAADLKLSEKSLEELVEIRDAAAKEIFARFSGTLEDMIYNGSYVAGKDIKVGSYTITNTSDGFLTVYIFDNEESYTKYQNDWSSTEGRLDLLECKLGKSMNVSLEEGNVLYIERGEGICKASKPSWAP